MKTIDDFHGDNFFLDNFYPCVVFVDGEPYQTTEHAYQAAKAMGENEKQYVRNSASPGIAKRRGNAIALRPDWDDVRVGVMRSLLEQKFARGTKLAVQLIATGDAELIEGNTWNDRFWGVDGTGLNWLGRLLMEIRTVRQKELETA